MYMGVSKMVEICHELKANGKPETTPAAVIEQGTRSGERVITGTLSSIHKISLLMDVKNPALLIIGEVVRMRDQLLRLADEVDERIG